MLEESNNILFPSSGAGNIVVNLLVEKRQGLMPVEIEVIDFNNVYFFDDKDNNSFYLSLLQITDSVTGNMSYTIRNDLFKSITNNHWHITENIVNYNPNSLNANNLFSYIEKNEKGYLECKQTARFIYKFMLINMVGTEPNAEFKHIIV